MQNKNRLIWQHDGKCSCGRRTFLFGRCPRCIKEEAQESLNRKMEEEPAEVTGKEDELKVNVMDAYPDMVKKLRKARLTINQPKAVNFITDAMVLDILNRETDLQTRREWVDAGLQRKTPQHRWQGTVTEVFN